MHIVAVSRRTLSGMGNPRFRVALADEFGEGVILDTASDSAVSYDVENFAKAHRNDPKATVTVGLTRTGRISTMTPEGAETRPMKAHELGRYVCVPAAACLKSPHITITADGLWVRSGGQFSSQHRDCYERGTK